MIPMATVTRFDVIEHFKNPLEVLHRIKGNLIVSVPIVRDLNRLGPHWVHFRPDEHIWYWTYDGFIRYVTSAGFDLKESSVEESKLGRTDIETFLFTRRIIHREF